MPSGTTRWGLQKAILAETAAKKSLDLTRNQLDEGQVEFSAASERANGVFASLADGHSGASEPL